VEEESSDFIGTHFARVPELMKAEVTANLVPHHDEFDG
jgi:hypothetical protein